MSATSTWPKGAWKAVRQGATYCAPACGHRCTWKQYQDALARARTAAKTLGPEWIPEASESMGWHSSIRRGTVCISVPSAGWGGRSFLAQIDGRGILGDGAKTAKGALRNLRAFLVAERDAAQAALDEVM